MLQTVAAENSKIQQDSSSIVICDLVNLKRQLIFWETYQEIVPNLYE